MTKEILEEAGRNAIMQDSDSEKTGEGYEPNLSDFAFFLSVMQVKKAHRNILSIILEEEDLELLEVKVEQVVLNRKGKRAIRMDAWALDRKKRQINTEMQNDTEQDDVRKRARFYQSIIDTPVLKAGKKTKYKHLPETIVIFITQEDIFGKDLAKYTFTEQCEEVKGLKLEDGTKKIFLNMKSTNGKPELISLLQYMKETRLDNPNISVRDKRLTELDEIVQEVKESEEWETVSMSIYSRGIQKGKEEGIQEGISIGESRGINLGENRKLIEQICKKLKKNKSVECIAEELEESPENIQQICTIAAAYAPDYDCEKICREWERR